MPLRSSWVGVIRFGLVTVPVRLYPATEEHALALHQVHDKDGSRVRMKRYCEAEDREIPYEEVARGYQSPTGRTVILTDQDLAGLPLPSKKVIDVQGFVDAERIDPLMLSRPYYVGTGAHGGQAYALLRETMARTGQAAVTKVTLSTRESLALLRAHRDTIVLQLMLWPDEVVPSAGIAPRPRIAVRPQELAMARSLMDILSEGFNLQDVRDEYQNALRDVVDARLHGTDTPPSGPARVLTPTSETDLMGALTRSVQAATAARAVPHPNPEPAKKAKSAAKTSPKAQPPARRPTAADKTTSTTNKPKGSGRPRRTP